MLLQIAITVAFLFDWFNECFIMCLFVFADFATITSTKSYKQNFHLTYASTTTIIFRQTNKILNKSYTIQINCTKIVIFQHNVHIINELHNLWHIHMQKQRYEYKEEDVLKKKKQNEKEKETKRCYLKKIYGSYNTWTISYSCNLI